MSLIGVPGISQHAMIWISQNCLKMLNFYSSLQLPMMLTQSFGPWMIITTIHACSSNPLMDITITSLSAKDKGRRHSITLLTRHPKSSRDPFSLKWLTQWSRVTYTCVQAMPVLVEIMVCRLFGDKPSSESILSYFWLDCEIISMKLQSKLSNLLLRKCN